MSLKQGKRDADSVMDRSVAPRQMHVSEILKKELKMKKKMKVAKPTIAPVELKAPAAEPEKTFKATSEIDDIFGRRKRRKTESGPDDDAGQVTAKRNDKGNSEVIKLNSNGELVRPKKKLQVTKPRKSTFAAAAPTSRKKTEDGFTVYSAEELGFNKRNAGGTKLCPFDCDCCF